LTERVFRDTRGAEWRVLEVHPSYRDRRRGEDRRQTAARATRQAAERRRGADRRVRPGGRLLLGESFQSGWLCFLAGDGGTRRRVAPIPPGWQGFSDHQLARFLDDHPADLSPRHTGDRDGREARDA
jgi:hypothetical protein